MNESGTYTFTVNLENGILEPIGQIMKRIKLPIPKEYGGGWATGETYEDAVKNLLKRVKNQLLTHSNAPKFNDIVDRWFLIKMGEDCSPSTIACYKGLNEKYISKFFSGRKIDQIKPDDIQSFFNSIMKLSKSVSDQCKAVLCGVFEYAERNDIIEKNPMRFKYKRSDKKGTKTVLQDSDLVRVIQQLGNLEGKDYLYACFLCFTALRRGEILGLKWEDIDFDRNEISVRRSVSYPNGINDYVIGEPKDGSSGVVHLNSELAKRIQKHLGKPATYIIPYSEGELCKPITRSMFVKMWRRIEKTLDLKGATSHSFRATYATMMNAHCEHIDPKALQGALRHKTPDLAIKVYTKENEDKTRKAEMEYDKWLTEKIAT